MSDDYDGLDMGGLPGSTYAAVPADVQRAVIAAIPELRVLWNPVLKKFQCVHRQPGWREPYYNTDGNTMLHNWSLIPGDYAPNELHTIVPQLRAREALAIDAAQRGGFESPAQQAEAIYDAMVAKAKQDEEEAYNDLLGLDVANRCMKSGVVHLGNMVPSKSGNLPLSPAWLQANAVPATGSAQRRAMRAARAAREKAGV